MNSQRTSLLSVSIGAFSARALLLFGFFLLAWVPGVAGEGLEASEKSWLKTVRLGPGHIDWLDAVAKLGSGSGMGRDALFRELESLLTRARKEQKKPESEIHNLLKKAGASRGRLKLLDSWQEAYRHANEWLFDIEAFPNPPGGQVSGPYIGYQQARKRGDAAIAIFKKVDGEVRSALAPVLRQSSKKAKALLENWARLEKKVTAIEAVLEHSLEPADDSLSPGGKAEEKAERVDDEVFPLALLLLDLRSGNLKDVDHRIDDLSTEWTRLLAWTVYCQTILDWNARNPCGMGKMAVKGMVRMNAYRMAIGMHPLWHNEQLVRTSQGHSTEMTKLGYFGHESPVPVNRNPDQRARNEGYDGRVTECCAMMSDPSGSVEAWKWDGGHHRAMIHWQWREVGCSTKGPCTLNPGSGGKLTPPGIRLE